MYDSLEELNEAGFKEIGQREDDYGRFYIYYSKEVSKGKHMYLIAEVTEGDGELIDLVGFANGKLFNQEGTQ